MKREKRKNPVRIGLVTLQGVTIHLSPFTSSLPFRFLAQLGHFFR